MEKYNDLDRAILMWCNENLPNGRRTNTEVEINDLAKTIILSRIENLVSKGYINIGKERIKELGTKSVYYLEGLTEKGKEYLED